eukprot:14806-Heterococcus_DN1.PRE.6
MSVAIASSCQRTDKTVVADVNSHARVCFVVLLTPTEFIPEADSGYSAELVTAVTLQSLHNTSSTQQQHQQYSSCNSSSGIDYEGLSALECFDSTVLLAPDDTHQYTYRVKRYVSTADSSSSSSATVQEQILSKGLHTLGHIELAWRTTLGECGAVASGPIQCDVTQQGGVHVALYTVAAQHTAATTTDTEQHQQQPLAVDTPLQLGKVASCIAAVSNLTDKPMHLGELQPYETRQYPLKLLPLVAGLHEVKGCTVVDMQTAQEYSQPKLADVFVEA